LIEVHVRTMLQEHPIVRVYFQEKESLGEDASRSVKSKEVEFTKMMASTIKAGQKQGLFRSGSAELIVNAILGMLIWVYQWYRPECHGEADINDVFWQLLAGGLVIAPKGEAIHRRKVTRANSSRPTLRLAKPWLSCGISQHRSARNRKAGSFSAIRSAASRGTP